MITENAYAKINLTLNITGLRQDGYHSVDMLMQTVALHDTITLWETTDIGIWIESDCTEMGDPFDNLAYKAAKLLSQRYQIEPHLKINIQKKIFIAAGLAGGSSDAAAVLRGCNKMWNLQLSAKELENVGAELGSDIPFLIEGGTARATGRGEILTQLPPAESRWVVLAKPENISINTAWAYKEFDKLSKKELQNPPTNVLELVTFKKYPLLKQIKATALEAGAELAMMSGSGPTIFALFQDYEKALEVAQILKPLVSQITVTKFEERISI